MKTAREQFEADYLLVVMNDASSWSYIVQQEKLLETYELASDLCDEFEGMVIETTEDINSTGKDLIRQMLIGQGMDTWYGIAKTIKEHVNG